MVVTRPQSPPSNARPVPAGPILLRVPLPLPRRTSALTAIIGVPVLIVIVLAGVVQCDVSRAVERSRVESDLTAPPPELPAPPTQETRP